MQGAALQGRALEERGCGRGEEGAAHTWISCTHPHIPTRVPPRPLAHRQPPRGFTMDCGEKHYKRLMKSFGTVVRAFLALEPMFQEVIADITRRMGEGMAEFIQKEVGVQGWKGRWRGGAGERWVLSRLCFKAASRQ